MSEDLFPWPGGRDGMSPNPGGEGGMLRRLGEIRGVSLELEAEEDDLTSVFSYIPC